MRWDDDRRFALRCELDAALFYLHLPADQNRGWHAARRSNGCLRDETQEQLADLKCRFPTPRDAVDYIMDTFPIIRRKDEESHGEYRTKRAVIEIYDAMQASIASGKCYSTRLYPPPADVTCCHQQRETI